MGTDAGTDRLATAPSPFLALNPSLRGNDGNRALKVSLEIPEDLGRRTAADLGGLPRAALEALAFEAVRGGKLTVSE
jgi:hypothetical protein